MLDWHKLESDILEFWKKKKIYEKLKKRNSKGKPFYFLQGPPYTSGKIHIGHAWNNSLKDIAMRYKRMQEFDVWDRGGYDMHGLPTEQAVQKNLKLRSKEDIEKFGMDKFVKECMKFSIEHANLMNEDFKKLGIWMDHDNAYKPIEKEFISGEWAFFKQASKQGRLYKGKKVMHWDAEAETSIAKHELEYKTIKDKSIFLKFKKKGTKNEYFLIWTTTPWTIPFNLAIMANPDVDYVKISVDGEFWIMAKALVSAFMTGVLGKKFKILKEFKGKELKGQEYEHFLNKEMNNVYDKLKKASPKIHSVVMSKEYVDTSSGTGLVHCAPGCGPEDNEVGRENKIEAFNTLNEKGEFQKSGKYTGWIAKDEDYKFIKEFEDKGVLLATTEVEHEYPHSDRTKKPVIFRTTKQWFLKIEDLVPKMLKMNKKVYWYPKRVGSSFQKWTENLKDNGVTRQRFWGCPVPIWINTSDPKDYIVIGSVKELETLTKKKFTDETIHRPWIDKVIIKKAGKTYRRLPDVSDVWIDSGTASWNCLYNDPKLIKRYFPADLILEATEQTRLWFSLLQICSAIMYKRTSYKNVYVHGMIFDFQGMKMSKSLGNIISPYEVLDKYSADILRYYMCGQTAGENISFNWEDVKVKQRNLLILQNTSRYILDLEDQKPKKGSLEVEEKWILSKCHSTIKRVTELFDKYRIDETISEIENLYLTLSRDYIKFVREKGGKNSAVLETVREVYLTVLKMFSTICPFLTESLWQQLKLKEESVHLSKWPKFDARKINSKLEIQFETLMKIIEVGLSQRDREKIGLRWPLAKATLTSNVSLNKELQEIVARQLNVKKVLIKSSKTGEIKVALDTKLTLELESEGYAREIARKVQAERKKRGLKRSDVINLEVSATPELRKMLTSQLLFLKDRTNSKSLVIVDKIEKKDVNFSTIKGKKVGIAFN